MTKADLVYKFLHKWVRFNTIEKCFICRFDHKMVYYNEMINTLTGMFDLSINEAKKYMEIYGKYCTKDLNRLLKFDIHKYRSKERPRTRDELMEMIEERILRANGDD